MNKPDTLIMMNYMVPGADSKHTQEMKIWSLFLNELVLLRGRGKAESSITSHVNAGKHFGIKAGLGLRKTLSPLRENLVHEG